ncbi:hypothetical protein QFC20_002986 [Naganishia adeliensis]|uniref:Uncharacterized protein n=1 Tax=Naganishia adeliensis TaxID=92952 RepID=A0ACC2WGQ6_9TREE|nr:hypothetical protein QFC20_002986 [Naganishia adeliensis]
MTGYAEQMKTFLRAPKFAVVGASTDRSKWGNKVLRWYQERSLPVTPVNPTAAEVEGLKAVRDATEVPDLAKTSISVIVNPAIGLSMMQKLFAGQPSTYPAAVWMQPGAESKSIEDFVKEKKIQDRVVMGGRCILVSGDGVREELRAEKGKL